MERLPLGDVASPASVPRGFLGEGTASLAGFALGVQKELLSSTSVDRQFGRISGKHMVSIEVQMRALSANEKPVTLTKQMKIDQCERSE